MRIFEFELFWITIAPSYYWLMYALAFIAGYMILKKQFFHSKNSIFHKKVRKNLSSKVQWNFMDWLLFYIFFWVVIGGRIWYMFLYNIPQLLSNPLSIFKVWEWWMSFHWWLLWVIIAMLIFCKLRKINFFSLSDHVATIIPIWLWLGRLWNYLNKELLWFWDYFWPLAVSTEFGSYFPSSLLELVLEWIILYFILNYIFRNKKFEWQVWSLFLILYWLFRIFVELFFRQPDAHIWYIFSWISLWTLYSVPMVVIGTGCYLYLRGRDNKADKL